MTLGDILFATGFDSKDPNVFDLSSPGTIGTTFLRTAQSIASYAGANADAQAALRDPATGLVTAKSEFVFGCGFYTGNASVQNRIISFISPNIIDNVQLSSDGSGHFRFWRNGNGGAILATGTFVLAVNTWYWLWGYVKIHDTTGIVRLKVNNVTDIATTTGLDTRQDAAAGGDTADRIYCCRENNYVMDDIYVQDATGTTNNGDDIDIGEVTIPYLVPNLAGDTTAWTPSAGSNFQTVDEAPPNDDTDYVAAGTSGNIDLYNLTDISGANAVKGVVVRTRAKKDTAGTKGFRQLLKSGGTVSNGPDIAPGTGYTTYGRALRKNPVTSADFTLAEITALQVGNEVRP